MSIKVVSAKRASSFAELSELSGTRCICGKHRRLIQHNGTVNPIHNYHDQCLRVDDNELQATYFETFSDRKFASLISFNSGTIINAEIPACLFQRRP